jgi:hypothetical protein
MPRAMGEFKGKGGEIKKPWVSFTVPDEAVYRRDRGQIILKPCQIILRVTGMA